MKGFICKARGKQNKLSFRRFFKKTYPNINFFEDYKLTYDDLKDIDPNYVPRCSFSLKHHLSKLF